MIATGETAQTVEVPKDEKAKVVVEAAAGSDLIQDLKVDPDLVHEDVTSKERLQPKADQRLVPPADEDLPVTDPARNRFTSYRTKRICTLLLVCDQRRFFYI
jgi:hypothetical protein